MKENLKFVSESVVDDLHSNIAGNMERYNAADFSDIAKEPGWEIETNGVKYDKGFVANLIHSSDPDAEVANSLLVYDALEGMTPALAREERIWVRLCHIDCIEYAKERWVKANPESAIKNHFFARTLSQSRDDNAIGRLWWNGYLGSLLEPGDPEFALKLILKRANIRLQFVDRANVSFRLPLAKGIVRLLESEPWFDSHDRAFEHYMLALDRSAGGLLFESSTDGSIDEFLKSTLPLAKQIHEDRVAS